MYPIKFRLSWDETTHPEDILETAYLLVECLARHNMLFLKYNPGTPPLYHSGVKYRAEKRDEEFLDIGEVLKQGHADCEDLCAWRIAELRKDGHFANPHVFYFQEPKNAIPWGFHIQVATATGIEDPSVILGMK